jgi:hypothetical protein
MIELRLKGDEFILKNFAQSTFAGTVFEARELRKVPVDKRIIIP